MRERDDRERNQEKLAGAMRIFQALSAVDEELLESSEEKKNIVPIWRYTRAMAACACFIVLGVAAWAGTVMLSPHDGTDSGSTAMQELAEENMDMEYNGAAEPQTAAAAEGGAAEDTAQSILTDVAGDGNERNMEQKEDVQNEAGGISGASPSEDLQSIRDEMAESDGQEIDWEKEPEMEWSSQEEGVEQLANMEAAKSVEGISNYIPAEIPTGYVYESGYRIVKGGATESISILWTKGMDDIHITIRDCTADAASIVLADVSKPESYDMNLYEIPYADSVPEGYREIFDNPVFAEGDFTQDVVKARMKTISDTGDTNTPRGNFAVLYDSGVLVEFNGRGDAESIWKMFGSIKP